MQLALLVVVAGCSDPGQVKMRDPGARGPDVSEGGSETATSAGPTGEYGWADQEGVVVTRSPELVLWSTAGHLWGIGRESGEWVGTEIPNAYFESTDCSGDAWIPAPMPDMVQEVSPALLGMLEEYLVDWPGTRLVRDPSVASLEVEVRSASGSDACSNDGTFMARFVQVDSMTAIGYRPDAFAGPLYPIR